MNKSRTQARFAFVARWRGLAVLLGMMGLAVLSGLIAGCDDKGADTDGASTKPGAVSTGKEGGAAPGLAPANGQVAPAAASGRGASPSPLPPP